MNRKKAIQDFKRKYKKYLIRVPNPRKYCNTNYDFYALKVDVEKKYLKLGCFGVCVSKPKRPGYLYDDKHLFELRVSDRDNFWIQDTPGSFTLNRFLDIVAFPEQICL